MNSKKSIWIYLAVVTGLFLIFANSCKKSDNIPYLPATATDIDGNIYHEVAIGTQIWMAENLKTTRYRNGDPIPNVTDGIAWEKLTSGSLFAITRTKPPILELLECFTIGMR